MGRKFIGARRARHRYECTAKRVDCASLSFLKAAGTTRNGAKLSLFLRPVISLGLRPLPRGIYQARCASHLCRLHREFQLSAKHRGCALRGSNSCFRRERLVPRKASRRSSWAAGTSRSVRQEPHVAVVHQNRKSGSPPSASAVLPHRVGPSLNVR